MPGLSGVKAARAIWREFPAARVIFWTQFPHEVYINEIRKIIKSVEPPPAYGFIHKNNPESRFLRFVAAVLEDGADMIDPAFKDSFKRPLLTEFEAEALYYLALGLSNWAIARKCSLSLRGVESRLATLYEKLFVSTPEGTPHEAYEKLAYNIRAPSLKPCAAVSSTPTNLRSPHMIWKAGSSATVCATSKNRKRKAVSRKQKAESTRRKAEGGKQKAEGRKLWAQGSQTDAPGGRTALPKNACPHNAHGVTLTAYCLLLTAYCLLPTAFCSPPSAFCLPLSLFSSPKRLTTPPRRPPPICISGAR
jgi:DNA-binding NarL/FixJ family response regulator